MFHFVWLLYSLFFSFFPPLSLSLFKGCSCACVFWGVLFGGGGGGEFFQPQLHEVLYCIFFLFFLFFFYQGVSLSECFCSCSCFFVVVLGGIGLSFSFFNLSGMKFSTVFFSVLVFVF